MFQSLPGFRDFYPEDCAVRNYIFSVWRGVSQRFSFSEWDAPTLEPLELFTEKSGEEIVSQLFNFEDKSGRKVSLRPEMTPSLARLVGARAGTLRRPVKWFGIGENFRYEKQQKGRLRAFYQLNADIFGEAGPAADAEIIALCIENLRAFGLRERDFKIRLSDRTLWFLFLESIGLADEALAVKALAVADKLERVLPEDALEMMKKALAGTTLDAGTVLAQIREFTAIKTLAVLQERFCGNAAAEARLADWRKLLETLAALDVGGFVEIDLSIVRGLAYYTGFVFEAFQTEGEARALAGGGRYDKLVKKLGGPDMPAVGFGMGDVVLRNLLEERGLLPQISFAPDFYALALSEDCRNAALEDAAKLRRAGMRIDYAFKAGKFGKMIQTAEQTGTRYALIYGPDELASGVVKVRDTRERREIAFPREQLSEALFDILENGLPLVETPQCHGDGNCEHCTCGKKNAGADAN